MSAHSHPPACPPWFIFSVSSVSSVVCFLRALHVVSDVGQAFQPAAGFPAGLAPLYPVPLLQPIAPAALAARRFACHTGTSCGASRQACHAGGHAGRATQSRAARASPRHPARTSARSTSTRALLFLSPCSLCPLWFAFSVFSVVCLLRALPTPSHNLPQIFFPFLFNHSQTRPFSFSCSDLVC